MSSGTMTVAGGRGAGVNDSFLGGGAETRV